MKQTGGKYVTVRWGSHGEFKIASKEGENKNKKCVGLFFVLRCNRLGENIVLVPVIKPADLKRQIAIEIRLYRKGTYIY
jgi:hypothetical protein